jgi:hypothetical protein
VRACRKKIRIAAAEIRPVRARSAYFDDLVSLTAVTRIVMKSEPLAVDAKL